MDEAATQASGLVVGRGLKRATLDPICRIHGAYVAIVDGEEQMLVGGTRRALDAVIHDALAAGAERTTILPVAVASHASSGECDVRARTSWHARSNRRWIGVPAWSLATPPLPRLLNSDPATRSLGSGTNSCRMATRIGLSEFHSLPAFENWVQSSST
jgi:hypothetical protein